MFGLPRFMEMAGVLFEIRIYLDDKAPLLRGGVLKCAVAGVCYSRCNKHTPPPLSRGESHAPFALSVNLSIINAHPSIFILFLSRAPSEDILC
jgi:hypothetical protein